MHSEIIIVCLIMNKTEILGTFADNVVGKY